MEGSPGTSLIKWQHNLAVTSVANAKDVSNRDPGPCEGDSSVQNLLQAELLLSATSLYSWTDWILKQNKYLQKDAQITLVGKPFT